MITPSFSLTATERVLPNLALDFTTATLDPRVTFTRSGNNATVINSSGLIETVNADIPRFDYTLNTGGDCKGLLIEESRTNLVNWSVALNFWSNNGGEMSVTTNIFTSPDGTQNAELVEAVSGNLRLSANSVSITSGVSYTMSAYVYPINATVIRFFHPTLGTVTFSNLVPNVWQRVSATGVASTTGTGNVQIRGTSVGQQWYIWGVQVEAGDYPSSFIYTSGSQVTRTADVATITSTNFSSWYSAGAGGVVARVLPSTVSGTRPVLQFDDSTADEVITLRSDTTNPELVIVDGGSPQAQIDAGTIAANTAYNLGAAWNTDNCAAAVDGGAAVTDTTAAIPTVTQARLGSDGTNYLNGHIQTLRYWPQRIINAEVQAFSK